MSDWAGQTYGLSGLGANDMLLAIATDGRAYSVQVPPNFELSSSQLTEVAQNDIRPQLADERLGRRGHRRRERLPGGARRLVVHLVVGGRWHRRRGWRRLPDLPSVPAQGRRPDGRPPSVRRASRCRPPEPLDQLSARSVQALIDTDNAVRASEFELSAAESEFGHEAVAHVPDGVQRRAGIVDRRVRDPAARRRRDPRGRH